MKELLRKALRDATEQVAESLRSCGIPISHYGIFGDSGDEVGGIEAGAEDDVQLPEGVLPPMHYGQLDVTVSELFG